MDFMQHLYAWAKLGKILRQPRERDSSMAKSAYPLSGTGFAAYSEQRYVSSCESWDGQFKACLAVSTAHFKSKKAQDLEKVEQSHLWCPF